MSANLTLSVSRLYLYLSTDKAMSKDKAKQNAIKPKVTAKQYDEAFDSLAAFLFEQYRKSKEEV